MLILRNNLKAALYFLRKALEKYKKMCPETQDKCKHLSEKLSAKLGSLCEFK